MQRRLADLNDVEVPAEGQEQEEQVEDIGGNMAYRAAFAEANFAWSIKIFLHVHVFLFKKCNVNIFV